MKLYVNSSESEPVQNFYIDIVAEYAVCDDIDVAAVKHIENDDEDWKQFVEDIISTLELYNFEVVKKQSSNSKNSESYYVSFYPCGEDGEILTKYFIHLRISKHEHRGKRSNNKKYVQKLADEHKKSSRVHQLYKFQYVTIGSEQLPSLESGLEYIENLCENLQQGRSDITNILEQFARNRGFLA